MHMKSVFINGYEHALVEFKEFLLLSWNLCTQTVVCIECYCVEKGYCISFAYNFFLFKKMCLCMKMLIKVLCNCFSKQFVESF